MQEMRALSTALEIQICPGTWLGAAPGAAAGLTAAMKPPPNLAVCI